MRTINAASIFALILVTFCSPLAAQTTKPTFLFLVEGRGVPTGTIHVFSVNSTSGALAEVPGSPFNAGLTPEQLVVDPTGRFVYVTNNQTEDITAFSVDATTGALTELPGSPFPIGAAPVISAVDPTGRFLYVFAVSAISGLQQEFLYEYTIDSATGVLTAASSSPTTWESQPGTIIDSIAFNPFGNYAYLGQVTGGTSGAPTMICSVDFGSGTLTQIGSVQPATAGDANLIAISPSGSFLYSVDSSLHFANAFTIDSVSGQLAEISGSPYTSLPNNPSSLVVHPSGNFLYIANENQAYQTNYSPSQYEGSISAFAIDSGSGALTAADGSPFAAGINPVSIVVDPKGKFAYAAATMYTSGYTDFAQITGYSIDPSSGVLTPFSGTPWTDSATSYSKQATISSGPSTTTNPTPMISSLTPSSTTATDTPFTLQVNGANFVPGSRVYFGGQPRSTAFVSSTQLNASILGSDVDNDGTAVVFVFSPLPGGGASTSVEFPVSALVPMISSISPSSIPAGRTPFGLFVLGANFVASSVVNFNGTPLPTSFSSSTFITGNISAAQIVAQGIVNISVTSPSNGVPGGGTSNTVTLTILPPVSPLTVSSISPSSATAGGPAFTLTLNGTGFVQGSQVTFNLNNVSTTFVNSTQVTASIPASAIAIAGNPYVIVTNPDGSASIALTFTVNNPQPVGGSASAGSNALTLDVTGVGFTHDSVVFINGNARVTTFVSSTMLQATLLPGDLSQSGALVITVMNPPPGGGTSAPISFANPMPQESLLSPSSAVAGSAMLSLEVTGSNFIATSIVVLNGAVLSTTYVSSTLLHAAIPASDLAQAATLNVSVKNPAPGGGTSPPLPFTIDNPQPGGSSVSPSSLPAGSNALTLTVTGTGFVSGSAGSVVLVSGAPRLTTYVSSTSVQANLLPGELSQGGTFDITVMNPPPGGGASSSLKFTVTDFSVASLSSPSSVTAGQTATFALTISPSRGAFSDPVSFSLSALPAGATGSFEPSGPITPEASPQTVTLSIATTPHTTASRINFPAGSQPAWPMLCLDGLILALAGLCSRTSKNRLQRLVPQLLLALLLLATTGLVACGAVGTGASTTSPSSTGPSSPPPVNPATGTPEGTYSITVTATSGAVMRTTTVTLKVM